MEGSDRVNDLVVRLVGAFNARDRDAFRSLFVDDAEFRRRGEPALRGDDGVRAVLDAAEHSDLTLAVVGEPDVDGNAASVPVKVFTAGRDTIDGRAVLELRDGKLAAFEIDMDS
jgi:hypothetical protein